MMTSRDGVHWERHQSGPIVPRMEPGTSGNPGLDWHTGLYAGCGLVSLRPDEHSLIISPFLHLAQQPPGHEGVAPSGCVQRPRVPMPRDLAQGWVHLAGGRDGRGMHHLPAAVHRQSAPRERPGRVSVARYASRWPTRRSRPAQGRQRRYRAARWTTATR